MDYVRLLGTRATLERLYRFSELLELWDAAVLPPAVLTVLAVSTDDKPKAPSSDSREKSPDYYANLGDVIRTLREDIPELFQRELNCKCGRIQPSSQRLACNILFIMPRHVQRCFFFPGRRCGSCNS